MTENRSMYPPKMEIIVPDAIYPAHLILPHDDAFGSRPVCSRACLGFLEYTSGFIGYK